MEDQLGPGRLWPDSPPPAPLPGNPARRDSCAPSLAVGEKALGGAAGAGKTWGTAAHWTWAGGRGRGLRGGGVPRPQTDLSRPASAERPSLTAVNCGASLLYKSPRPARDLVGITP